ncbi:MAG: hypothetical protein ABSH09_26945 [Bryobacteraceae bacterium]
MTLRISALAGASAGILSSFFFLSLAIGAGPYVPLILSIACCVALWMWYRPPSPVASARPHPWLLIAFFVVLAASVTAFIYIASKQPHGYREAYSIWNLHARFLERGGAHWTSLFSKTLNWSHPDYPLLIPALVAQFWALLQTETVILPIAVAFFFTFGTVAVLIGAIRQFRGWNQALIAGTFLLGSAELIEQGVVQYADVPLAFYLMAALALLAVGDAKSTTLAGAMAGFAAWTKNEGLLFIVVLAAALLIVKKRISAEFIIGLAPVLAVVAFFKLHYAPLLLKPEAFDFGRVVTVLQGFVVSAFELGTFLVPAILLLAAYGWLVGFKIDPQQRTSVAIVATTLALMLLGDIVFYVLFAADPAHPEAPYIQLFPSALLGFFMATANVEFEREKPKPRKVAATRHR